MIQHSKLIELKFWKTWTEYSLIRQARHVSTGATLWKQQPKKFLMDKHKRNNNNNKKEEVEKIQLNGSWIRTIDVLIIVTKYHLMVSVITKIWTFWIGWFDCVCVCVFCSLISFAHLKSEWIFTANHFNRWIWQADKFQYFFKYKNKSNENYYSFY